MSRIKLLQSVNRFQMNRLKAMQIYEPDFNKVALIICKLDKRIKRTRRKKNEARQLELGLSKRKRITAKKNYYVKIN